MLRRILRRALRYGKYIGLNEPFLYDSARVVTEHMGAAYLNAGSCRPDDKVIK